jgi:uncharacterized SAM-binding protein YcdF (DUF218 family)
MTTAFTNIYILLGSSSFLELTWRIEKLLEICKHKINYIILLTGTNTEVSMMHKELSVLASNATFIFETKSKNTIDNIVNSFSILNEKKELLGIDVDIISSEYHIPRIKYISFICNINKKITYHSSQTRIDTILKTRMQTENKISQNLEKYKNQILLITKI